MDYHILGNQDVFSIQYRIKGKVQTPRLKTTVSLVSFQLAVALICICLLALQDCRGIRRAFTSILRKVCGTCAMLFLALLEQHRDSARSFARSGSYDVYIAKGFPLHLGCKPHLCKSLHTSSCL